MPIQWKRHKLLFPFFDKKGPLNHQRARKNVRKAVYDGFSYCRTNLENSLCAKIDNQRDDDARDDIYNGKVDEKPDNHEGPDKNSETDEIKPFVQEPDVDITGTVVKKFGKHRTVHDVIIPGKLCKMHVWQHSILPIAVLIF